MNTYIGTKIIQASPMTRGAYNEYRGWVIPEDEDPADDGYLVRYDNPKGFYESWSPKDVFENSYKELRGMDFGYAISAVKLGYLAFRTGWDGKGMYIFLQPGSRVKRSELRLNNSQAFSDEEFVTIKPHIVMRASDGSYITGWVASQDDMLRLDWQVIPVNKEGHHAE